MAAPDWLPVIEASKPSIFFVVVRPKGHNQRVVISQMANSAESKEQKELTDACNAIEHYATGFAVGTVGEAERERILILTCAHLIEHVYHGARQPIDVATINRLYNIELYCPHSELDWIERGGQGPRSSFPAVACSVDCTKDMLLLKACMREIGLRTEHIGGGRLTETRTVICPWPHPGLQISTVLHTGSPCLILSWPSNLIHLFYQGYQCDIRMAEIISANAAGYDMSVLEAQIGSKEGSSGAPLLNLAGQVIGLLDGGFGGYHSYFVAPHHIQEFLTTAHEEAATTAAAEEAAAAAAIEEIDRAQLVWCGLRQRHACSERRGRGKSRRSC
ncbi:hypothetical protein ACQ4PT_028055 [Festuca glaucescens]